MSGEEPKRNESESFDHETDLLRRVRRAGLGGKRGPRETFVEGEGPSAYVERPSREAMELAWKLADGALDKLREQGTLTFGTDDGPRPATYAEGIANAPFLLGVPLLFATAPQMVALADHLGGNTLAEQMAEAASDAHEPGIEKIKREASLVLLQSLVAIEATLWRRAGEPRMPYACSFAATEWFCRREEDALAGDLLICVRCGEIGTARKVRTLAPGLRRCAYCASHPDPHPSQWKTHVIAPAHRGKWWLECQAADDSGLCSKAFLGRLSSLYCTDHSLNKTTRSKRAAVQAGSHGRYSLG